MYVFSLSFRILTVEAALTGVGLLIIFPPVPFQTNQPSNANNDDDTDGDNSDTSHSTSSSNEASDENIDQSDIVALIRRAKSNAARANDRGKKSRRSQDKGRSPRSGSGTPTGEGGRNRGDRVNPRRLTSISGVSKMRRQRRRESRGKVREIR
jgi:hypothetical protein